MKKSSSGKPDNILKVLTLVGTRPELIKLSRVVSELDSVLNHILVHTGQNFDYELNEIFFEQLGIRPPDHVLNAAGKNPAQTIANVIAGTDEILEKERPDAFLILGDTNSCLGAIAAKRRKIPVFHMEAGNRCFDQRVPEEINRKLIDHISDINLAYTEHARRYLVREGIRPETVFKTGSPMREVIEFHRAKIQASRILRRLKLKEKKFFLVSAHREENVDSEANLKELIQTLEAISMKYSSPIIFSTHPRTREKLKGVGAGRDENPLIRFLPPLGFMDYLKLQMTASCVLSDSGTITEESSLLGFPAVMIRQAHERPEGMDEGTLVMSGLNKSRVLEAIELVLKQSADNVKFRAVPDYEPDNVSKKVVRIILSYTDYVNRTVWFK